MAVFNKKKAIGEGFAGFELREAQRRLG